MRKLFTILPMTMGLVGSMGSRKSVNSRFSSPGHRHQRDITFADGRKLFLGSSGTGAPLDGRDPNDKK